MRRITRSCALFALSLATAFMATPVRAADTVVPPAMFVTADPQLEVTLWAASPMLKNPTNVDFDMNGRLWVAEGVNYRGHHERQPAGDRIVVLEDTDKDGKADKSSVFVQEPFLRAPLGIAVMDNKIVVSMTPDLIVYTDVNRDLKFDPKVDKREVILTGFNGRNHDHSLHSVTAGPDGQWYFNAGNSGAVVTDKSGATFRVGGPYDPYYGRKKPGDLGWDPREIAGQKSDDGHVYLGGFAARINPDGSRMRIIGHNFRNSYEQTVTSFGDVFQNDNDDPPACRTTYLLEFGNAGFFSRDGQRTWGADRRPGQSVPTAEWRQEDPGTMPSGDVYGGGAPTGIAFVEDSALGKKYRGTLLSAEPARNVIFSYAPKAEGAGFSLKRNNFLTSNRAGKFAGSDFEGGDKSISSELHTYFRPSDVTVGPDGAIYVADFFDPRVGGHADKDDTLSGAIYRIAPKGFKSKISRIDISVEAGAIAALKSPAVNVRGAGFSALVARGTAAVPAVSALLRDENPYVQARAVWLLSRLGSDGRTKVQSLQKSPNEGLRVVAFRALRRLIEEEGVQGHAALSALAAKAAIDRSAAVRREAALSLRDVPAAHSREILVTLAKAFDGKDATYLEAWGTGSTGKESEVYDALAATMGKGDPVKWSPAFERLAWRLHPGQSVEAFRARALAPALPDAKRRAAMTAIAFCPTQAAANAMLDIAEKTEKILKADATWWLLNRKDNEWKAFGLAAALKDRGVYDEDKIVVSEAILPRLAPPALTPKDVLSIKGNASKGAKVIPACLQCHRLGEQGTDYGPNLTGWAQRQTSEVLALSILNPAAEIAHGYGGNLVELKDGTKIFGHILAGGDPLIIQSQGGVTQTVPGKRIQSKKALDRSLMLSGEELGLDKQNIADLIAYLRSHKP